MVHRQKGLAAGPAAIHPGQAFQALLSPFLSERDRWPLWLPVLIGVGIAVYFSLSVEPPVWLGVVGLVVTAGAWIIWRSRPFLSLFLIATAVVWLGFSAAQWRAAAVAEPVLSKRLGPVAVSGRVVTVEARPTGRRLTLESLSIDRLSAEDIPYRVRVVVRSAAAEAILAGDWLNVRAVLLPPPGPAAPGAFDFARRAWFQRLGAVGYTVSTPQIQPPPSGAAPVGWSARVAGLRQAIADRVRAALPGPSGAVAAALMTGDRGAIPEHVLDAMRDSGLAHLLAISGLHIGMVAGIVFFACRGLLALIEPVALRYPIKKWAAVAALLAAAGYLLLSGATVPTQRAFLMTALVLLAVMLDRSALSMRLVAWAAALILLLTPESLLSVSFQMSFAAVVALIAGYEALRGRFTAWRSNARLQRRVLLYIGGICLTTVIASLATTPFALYHFNRVVHYALAANLVAVPLMGFWIMPWAVLAFVLLPFGLEGLALGPMGWGIDLVTVAAETVAGWPGAVHLLPSAPPAALGLVAFGGLWLCLWRHRWRWLGLPVVLLGPLLTVLVRPPDVLIDAEGKLAAVRDATGQLHLTRKRSDGFTPESWLRRAGVPTAADGGFHCDRIGCIAAVDGTTIAYVKDPRAIAEDCRHADIVVAAVPVRSACPSARLVVDRFDLWRRGAHAIWLDGGAPRSLNAADVRGDRPWSVFAGRTSGRD